MEIVNKLVCCTFIIISPHLNAGVLDRSGQPLDILAESGNTLSYRHIIVKPEVTGTDSQGGATGDVTNDYKLQQLNLKTQLNKQWSFAFILDKPWGGDFQYDDSSVLYGGSKANLETQALSAIGQYSLNDRVSLYGGLRYDQIDGELALSGLAFGPFAGYRLDAEKTSTQGYLVGTRYEIKPYALRLSLSYFSDMEYRLDSQETLPAFSLSNNTTTEITLPQAINIDFQTGIAPKTLFIARLRWVDWSEFVFKPETLDANGLTVVDVKEDIINYRLGLVRQFTPQWLGGVAWLYEPKADDANSLFRPSNGYQGIGLAGIYQPSEQWQLRASLSVVELGDARAETQGGNSVTFEDNQSTSLGFEARYRF